MTGAPLAPYPALRPRRLRQADWIRRLTRETVLAPNDLIWSMVVHDGPEDRVPVASMPGVERLSVTEAAKAAVRARAWSIPAIAVFPHIDGQGQEGTPAAASAQSRRPDRPGVQGDEGTPRLRSASCATSRWTAFTLRMAHDGLIEDGRIWNDPTIRAAGRTGADASRGQRRHH